MVFRQAITLHWNGTQWVNVPTPKPDPDSSLQLHAVTIISTNEVWAAGISRASSTGGYAVSDSLVLHWNGTQWTDVEDAVDGSSELFGIVDVGTEVWAVGGRNSPETLIERWNGSSWSVVPSHNPGLATNVLSAVEVLSPDNVWAVGRHYLGAGGLDSKPLVQHWDGAQWQIVPSPTGPMPETLLNDITAISPNDIWAVGMSGTGGDYRTFTLHWNGTDWSIVPSPNSNEEPHYLYGVDGAGWNDVWAVGLIFAAYGISPYDRTLTLHWSGSNWAIIPSPNVEGQHNQLQDIDILSPGNGWAVGSSGDNSTGFSPLILRLNGSVWSIVPTPNLVGDMALSGVSALSNNDVWAVGQERVAGIWRTLVLHWDGTSWQKTPSPNWSGADHLLTSVKAIAPNDVWAVGYFGGTIMLHWDGTAWSIASVTVPGLLFNLLNSVDASASGDVWTVGSYSSGGYSQTLVQHVGRFSDVSPADFYYAAVNYLVAQGALTGYDDCTFRPQNNATRGQLSKIVTLAEGWPLLNPPQPTFADVPPGSTFYTYIETLFSRGAIGGYPCGGPGEPCDPQNRPYFRPNADITRAQLAKVVVLARRWTLSDPPVATFADVPVGSPFYRYVETAVAHNILSGYPCGNPEPCDPQNRPVFRPNNNATRGQIAKIVYNAVTQP
jgi:hypothetical protein